MPLSTTNEQKLVTRHPQDSTILSAPPSYEATRWGRRVATINSISPGIIITPLANDELHGPRKDGYLKMIEGMPARRAGTPDEVGDLAEFLMSSRGRFISGADILIDGGCTASYWYGDLQYLKATH